MTTETITAIFAGLTALVAAAMPGYLAWRKGQENALAIQELHVAVDGRLTKLLEVTGAAKFAEGKIDERGIVHQENEAALNQAKATAREILDEAVNAAAVLRDQAAESAKLLKELASETARAHLARSAPDSPDRSEPISMVAKIEEIKS
jgi:hypothetical protein